MQMIFVAALPRHIEDAIGMTVALTKVWLKHGDIPAEMNRQIRIYVEDKQ